METSDIVERLRYMAEDSFTYDDPNEVHTVAANEIERLRAAVRLTVTNVTLNLAFATMGAKLADAGYLDQADRILALVGHQDNNQRSAEDVTAAVAHAESILLGFPRGMCDECADALVDWSLHWTRLPEAVAALRLV